MTFASTGKGTISGAFASFNSYRSSSFRVLSRNFKEFLEDLKSRVVGAEGIPPLLPKPPGPNFRQASDQWLRDRNDFSRLERLLVP
jgi:hypothetical protein